jgi:hypothetical protein
LQLGRCEIALYFFHDYGFNNETRTAVKKMHGRFPIVGRFSGTGDVLWSLFLLIRWHEF